jgi:hypothetical protein
MSIILCTFMKVSEYMTVWPCNSTEIPHMIHVALSDILSKQHDATDYMRSILLEVTKG